MKSLRIFVPALLAVFLFAQCQCNNSKTKEAAPEDGISTEQQAVEGEATGTQKEEAPAEKEEYNIAEIAAIPEMKAPVFALNGKTGDTDLFLKFVYSQIVYPEKAKEDGIEGRVTLSFLVGKDGKVQDVKVEQSADPILDAEAVRAVNASPAWTPAKNAKGNPVATRYIMPVNFQLR